MPVYSAIGIGSGVLIAQAYGRKDMGEVPAIAALGLIVAGAFGLCTALPLALFPAIILRWVGAEENVANEAAGYFQLFAASAPLVVIAAVRTATFRSLSDTRPPMVITIGTVALNTLLSFLLVPGIGPFPKLGVLDAGVATLFAQCARCLFYLSRSIVEAKGRNGHDPSDNANKLLQIIVHLSQTLQYSK